MAHVEHAGVYKHGIRVVLDKNIEALWNVDGAAGLDAEIVSDGVLIGFVPHVSGSENFTDEQIVECIATTRYTLEGLHPPAAEGPYRPAQAGGRPSSAAPLTPHPVAGRRRWTDRFRRRGR